MDRDGLILELQNFEFEPFIPRTTTWKLALVSSCYGRTLIVLIRKNGIDFKYYEDPKELKIDTTGKLHTDGGLLTRFNYNSADKSLHQWTLKIANKFVYGIPLHKMFLEGYDPKYFNKFDVAKIFAINLSKEFEDTRIRVRRNKKGFNVYVPRKNQDVANKLLTNMAKELGGRPVATGAFGASLIQLFSGTKNAQIEPLVIDAFQRSTLVLTEASISEISNYLHSLSPQQLEGVVNNVKGIYHELAFVNEENVDSDEWTATIFANTNHQGSDVLLSNSITGDILEIQLKATDSSQYALQHLDRYPEIELLVTEEVAEATEIESSGFSNAEIESNLDGTITALSAGQSSTEEIIAGTIFDVAIPGIGIAAAVAGVNAASENKNSDEIRKEVTKAVVKSAPISIALGLLFGLF